MVSLEIVIKCRTSSRKLRSVGPEKSERKIRRATLGPLESLVLRPATIARYHKAFQAFVKYPQYEGMEIASTKTGLDQQLVDYLDFLWEDGEPLSLAGDTPSSIQYYQPSEKQNINQAWRMLKTW